MFLTFLLLIAALFVSHAKMEAYPTRAQALNARDERARAFAEEVKDGALSGMRILEGRPVVTIHGFDPENLYLHRRRISTSMHASGGFKLGPNRMAMFKQKLREAPRNRAVQATAVLVVVGIVASHLLGASQLMVGVPFALGATKTWTQTSGNLASTDANWDGGTKPVAGDAIVFDATSTANCTWDLTLDQGSFTLAVGYSGVVTQAASFSVTSYSQLAGTFTGSATYTLTSSGNFSRGGGTTFSAGVTRLIMTGSGTSIGGASTFDFNSLTINNNVTLAASTTVRAGGATIASGMTLTLNVNLTAYATGTITNSGIITGLGTLIILVLGDATKSLNGTISCPVTVSGSTGLVASATVTLSADATLSGALSVASSHASYTCTLDLSASNYALTSAGITIGTRGILNGRASNIYCAGTFDYSAGTFTKGTSRVILTATGNLKGDGTNGLCSFRTAASTTTTLQSAMSFSGDFANLGTFTRGANAVTLNGTGQQVVYGWPDTAITVNSTGPVVFINCSHHVADVTFTAGTCIWFDSRARTWASRGNYTTTAAFVYKPKPGDDVHVLSGTLTLHDGAQLRDLTIDAGTTCVQPSGAWVWQTGRTSNAGTLTKNSPEKWKVGLKYNVMNPPLNPPINDEVNLQ